MALRPEGHGDSQGGLQTRTRTRTNTKPNGTEANAAGRSGNARALRARHEGVSLPLRGSSGVLLLHSLVLTT